MLNPEKAILGSILLTHGNALDELTINADDFNDLRLGRVYQILRDMKRQDEPIDPITVAAKLPTYKTDVYDWQTETPTSENVGYYATMVRDRAIRRTLNHTAQRLVSQSETDDLDVLIDTARSELGSLAERRTDGSIEYISHLALSHLDTLSQPRHYLPGPWKDLNQAINGFRPGAMYVIGARPGVGKTVVGLQIAYHLSKQGPVSFHSLEMSKAELLNRLYSLTSSVYLGNLERGKLNEYDWKALAKAKGELSQSNLAIIDKGGQTINDIRAHARTLQQNGGLNAIVVDYIGLIRDIIPGRKRYEAISDFSVALKTMARDFGVPVIALAQLNRQSEQRLDKMPQLSDLRDSGAIEQDADVVMLLSRHKRDKDRDFEMTGFTIDVAKNRHGITGEIDLVFNGGCARVDDAG
jgi:replicative DNA helicase|tara:strand:- start:1261 stop:2493 length:1233 start_codon:yes stop_codon:yes gene_type:complete